ncbi:hypothetical protein Bca52824_027907 [Brassica carinata]|uniref:Leucine-rich repeat-containing N-terminal plant-type domain-containing protein n=1 Tax=Brassica carinata TaxID=52824 RepID=A0A8X7VBB4_BRACI|nr:hypothetical protein Bca52824_027907 [Brassica carinata]
MQGETFDALKREIHVRDATAKSQVFEAIEKSLALAPKHKRTTTTLSIQRSGGEITEILTKISITAAGTGITVLFTVICSLASSRVPLCTNKFFNTGLGFSLASKFNNETDKQALVEFESHLSENSRVVLASWNESFAVCKWTGVTCGRKHKRVTGLDLSRMKLTGAIPPSVGNLSFLTSLSLSGNSFHGSLSSLVLLSLRANNLTGKLPASLGNLTSLEKLDVEYNRMEGEIPYSMSRLTRMKFLRIASNSFSGVFPHPICNLSSLLFLSIPENRFFGRLKIDFNKLFPNIQVLLLGGNNFEGEIPSSLVNISSLRKFDIAECHITGSSPSGFGRLYNLEILGLNYNSLGSYSPRDLDFLSSLNNCTKLQYLGVGSNRLGGILPPSISNLSKQLTYVFLGGNHIAGSIPLDIGNLECLVSFKVEENLLTGEIPASLGKLSRLESLYLQSNMMSGDIPSSLGNLSMIAKLYLYQNSFKGSIPSSLRNCSYLLYLVLRSNMLSGSIPQELMEFRGLRVGFPIAECLTLVLELGLRCCEEFPSKRLSMSEVAKQLFKIRERFFKARRAA